MIRLAVALLTLAYVNGRDGREGYKTLRTHQ
jgi:hypothetical protein